MVKITVGVEGMMCSHCEAHVNDCIRNNFSVKSVKSDHKKNVTVITAENDIPQADIAAKIAEAGYTATTYTSEPYEKKGLFR